MRGDLGTEVWRSFSSLDIENLFVQVENILNERAGQLNPD